MQRFSTSGLPSTRAKIDYLKQVLSSVFTDLDVEPDVPGEFDNHIRSTGLGGLSIAHATSAPARIIRRHGVAVVGEHLYFLHTQLEGRMHAVQDGREGWLEPGDMVLCDTAAPYDLGLSGPSRTLILGIPASELRRRVVAPHSLLGRRLPGAAGPMRMVRTLVTEVWEQADGGDGLSHPVGDRLGATILDLFATACHMQFGAGAEEGALADGHRARIRRFVEARLFDPELSPAGVAAALGLSPRYLRLLLAGDGESLTAYLLRRRLEECARQLRDPNLAGRSVTEVAFACGFNDASHFSRAFKARFGRSPRDYRQDPFIVV